MNDYNNADMQIRGCHNLLDQAGIDTGGTAPQRLEKYTRNMIETIKHVDGMPDDLDWFIAGLIELKKMSYIRKDHEEKIDLMLGQLGYTEPETDVDSSEG